jgi:ATP-binding cassette, subfamily F, member 3
LDGLSGGERRRLSLAILVHSGANLLILDEPTNHLDLESREALEAALAVFPGSLLLVSHDRALLDAIGSRTIELHDHDLHSYVGGWPEYVRVRAEREAKPEPKPEKPKPTSTVSRPAKAAKPKGSGGNGARRLESEIEAAEAALATIEDELADPSAWATPEATARSTERHEEAKRRVAELYERYEAVAG